MGDQKTDDGTHRPIVLIHLKSGMTMQGPADFAPDFAHYVILNGYEHDPGDHYDIPWASIDYLRYLPEETDS